MHQIHRGRPRHRGSENGAALDGHGALTARVKERILFLQAFLRQPARVGAIGPSSAALARAMLSGAVLEGARTVVELGPGTGAFTALIVERLPSDATFFALEIDPGLARGLRARFPGLTVYNDSAERLATYASRHCEHGVDLIVSGLPWASIPLSVQEKILEGVLAALKPGGTFATFGYVHARWFPNALRFRRRLERSFPEVRTSRVVWGNFPPAFIYRCVR